MQTNYRTQRLRLDKLTGADAGFIEELLNTPGWLQFIGNRNINNLYDATAYIEKISANINVTYWVVRLQDQGIPIGIITLIKRDYLDHPDIGFAFLPAYAGKGFAYEAASIVCKDITKEHSGVLAITIRENKSSIKLLEKLGLAFSHEIINEGEALQVFALHSPSTLL